MDETLDLIQQLANERHNLYRSAAKQQLTPEQQERLAHLNVRLPMLWEQYRAEYAGQRRSARKAA